MITKKANLLHVLNNVYFKKAEPVSIVHFLTNRCNARCSFCFIDFEDPNTFKNELTLSEIDELTKNLGKSLLNVNLTGGEPFARKDITEIAKLYIKNTNIQSIYVTTNASLPDRVENFAKAIIYLDKNIKLISFNSIFYDSNNLFQIKNDTEDSKTEYQFKWLETELMQFGFLFWEGVTYDWEDTMAYTDTYGATQQDESSGKWEDLG